MCENLLPAIFEFSIYLIPYMQIFMLLSEEIDIKTITIITNLVELWVNMVCLAALLNCSFRQEAIVWQLASRNFWFQHLLNIFYANFHAFIRKILILIFFIFFLILNSSFRPEAFVWQLASFNFWIQHLFNTLHANFHASIRKILILKPSQLLRFW